MQTRLPLLLDPNTFGNWTREWAQDGEQLPDGSGSLGDWYETNLVQEEPTAVNDGAGRSVAEVYHADFLPLILAAPDLARACTAMLDAYGNCGTGLRGEASRMAEAALRKAGVIR